jgi:hypothetical protein
MKRIDSSTVELTDQEQRFSVLHECMLDNGHGQTVAFVRAWQELNEFGWLPSAEFCEWTIGPTSSMDSYVDDTLYEIHCLMQTCPDHGPVAFVDGGETPSMAGGHDSYESWSCGCVISTTPYSHSRRRPDGTYSDDCGGR